jgi:pimeloyl-ACP methyl ester carboxylesterase
MTRSNAFKGLRIVVVAVALIAATTATGAREQEKHDRGVTNVVLVHGAWADGSSWSKVISLLEAKGLHVDAVQLPSHHRRTTLPPYKERSRGWTAGSCLLLIPTAEP